MSAPVPKKTDSELMKENVKSFAAASGQQMKSALQSAKEKSMTGLHAIFDPLKAINAYNVLWIVIWLLVVGIFSVAFSMENGDNKNRLILGLAGGAIVLGMIGVAGRFLYRNQWSSLMRSAPTDMEPLTQMPSFEQVMPAEDESDIV